LRSFLFYKSNQTKMKALVLSSLLCLVFASGSFARVGENETEIEARYGKPGKDMGTQDNVHQVGYMAQGFMILVDFVGGVSQREGFANPDTSPLSNEAIEQILKLNTPEGEKWRQRQEPSGEKSWRRTDEKVVAICPPPGVFLFVQDIHYTPPTAR
jgi:hypothetical protein